MACLGGVELDSGMEGIVGGEEEDGGRGWWVGMGSVLVGGREGRKQTKNSHLAKHLNMMKLSIAAYQVVYIEIALLINVSRFGFCSTVVNLLPPHFGRLKRPSLPVSAPSFGFPTKMFVPSGPAFTKRAEYIRITAS